MAVVLHSLQQRLDRLGPEVLPHVGARPREGVRLVDEEDAVEGALDRAVGLDRRRPHVLADEPRPVDLDQVALLEQAHRAVHLREQARDRRLARPRVAEEDEVLRGRNLGQAVLEPPRLHLEERDQRPHLLLHSLEADERVELRLELLHRQRRQRLPETVGHPVDRVGAGALAQSLADHLEAALDVFERVRAHSRDQVCPPCYR